MSKSPDYDRARNALAHKAQRDGFELHISRTGAAFSRDFYFHAQVARSGVPVWNCPYIMGSGHASPEGHPPEPELADILHAIFLDASCYENVPDLLEFCAEFGYDIDEQEGRKSARGAYNACRRVARDLHDKFTDDEYAEYEQLIGMM